MATHNVEATLSGEATLAATDSTTVPIEATLSGEATLAATDSTTVPIEATLSGEAVFTLGPLATPVSASLSGEAVFLVEPYTSPDSLPAVVPVGADSVSAGLAMEYANNVPGPFRAETTWGTLRYYQALPGIVALLNGTGTSRLKHTPWRLGAVKADIIAGTLGGDVITLLDDFTGFHIVASLDANSRPGLVVQDAYGTVIAQANPWGANVPEGYRLSILFSWNADTGAVTLTVNGQATPAWAAYPATPWTPFRPLLVEVGDGSWNVQQVQVGRLPV